MKRASKDTWFRIRRHNNKLLIFAPARRAVWYEALFGLRFPDPKAPVNAKLHVFRKVAFALLVL